MIILREKRLYEYFYVKNDYRVPASRFGLRPPADGAGEG
jgi:hypothetical protein